MAIKLNDTNSLKQISIEPTRKIGNEYINFSQTTVTYDGNPQYEYKLYIVPLGITALAHSKQLSFEITLLRKIGFSTSIFWGSNG